MTRSPVKVPLSSETVKASVENWRQLELRTTCEKFLATPLKTHLWTLRSCNWTGDWTSCPSDFFILVSFYIFYFVFMFAELI